MNTELFPIETSAGYESHEICCFANVPAAIDLRISFRLISVNKIHDKHVSNRIRYEPRVLMRCVFCVPSAEVKNILLSTCGIMDIDWYMRVAQSVCVCVQNDKTCIYIYI